MWIKHCPSLWFFCDYHNTLCINICFVKHRSCVLLSLNLHAMVFHVLCSFLSTWPIQNLELDCLPSRTSLVVTLSLNVNYIPHSSQAWNGWKTVQVKHWQQGLRWADAALISCVCQNNIRSSPCWICFIILARSESAFQILCFAEIFGPRNTNIFILNT